METGFMNKFLGLMLITLAFATMFSSQSLFYTGFHNVDLAHNFMKISSELDAALLPYNINMMGIEEVYDNSTAGLITLQEGYRIGISEMRESTIFSFLSGMSFVFGVILILTPSDKTKFSLFKKKIKK